MPGCQGVAKRGATVKVILDRLLLQHNPDALLAIAENGEILHWNDAAEAIFGYSRDEALGRLLNDLIVPPDRRDEERRIREDALRYGLAVYESVRRRKDGLLLHVSVTTKAIRDAGGNLEYFLSTKKDVTHLKVMRDAKLVESKFQRPPRIHSGRHRHGQCHRPCRPDQFPGGKPLRLSARGNDGPARGNAAPATISRRPSRSPGTIHRAAAHAHDGRRPRTLRAAQERRRISRRNQSQHARSPKKGRW